MCAVKVELNFLLIRKMSSDDIFGPSEQKPVVVAPGGSASFVYVVLRDGVGRWQLTGRG